MRHFITVVSLTTEILFEFHSNMNVNNKGTLFVSEKMVNPS